MNILHIKACFHLCRRRLIRNSAFINNKTNRYPQLKKNMNKLTLLFILLSINLNAFSQDINEVKRDMLVKALYSNDSIRYNNTKHNVFRFEEYKETDFFKVIITHKE